MYAFLWIRSMRIFHLQVVNTLAKTGNKHITAKMLNLPPTTAQQTIRRAENQLGVTLFHRIPWTNRTPDHLWNIANDKARTIIKYIDAMLFAMTMAEETAFIASLQKPDAEIRHRLRTEDIERVVVLNGNSITLTARSLGDIDFNQVADSLAKIEKWLGIQLYSNRQSGRNKFKILTRAGERVFPYLVKIYSYYEDILELVQ